MVDIGNAQKSECFLFPFFAHLEKKERLRGWHIFLFFRISTSQSALDIDSVMYLENGGNVEKTVKSECCC